MISICIAGAQKEKRNLESDFKIDKNQDIVKITTLPPSDSDCFTFDSEVIYLNKNCLIHKVKDLYLLNLPDLLSLYTLKQVTQIVRSWTQLLDLGVTTDQVAVIQEQFQEIRIHDTITADYIGRPSSSK